MASASRLSPMQVAPQDRELSARHAAAIRAALPPGGLFAGQTWRTATGPFALGEKLAKELDSLGRVLLQFYRAANLLHRQSSEGRQPAWIARWLDQGKSAELLRLQHAPAFKNELPRVIHQAGACPRREIPLAKRRLEGQDVLR